MIGQTIAHYRITAAIGAGGMGDVYRATDTRLGRDVALKVLPADVGRDPDRLARFQREAKALAALDHPNIVTVFSVEEADGVHFLTMQLVEGQALDRVIPEGGLPVERIVEIATAMAEALAAAHEKGIVHRDLKPANVMITTDGRVKVLDFGLAKELKAVGHADATFTSAGRTQAGVVMGTPAYMSPEQVAGRAVDHRSDIFSLGALLYEMATGSRPFEGDSSAELASAILRDAPRPLADVRADLPADLARIVRRCLEKDPHHRLQTARDVGNEFRDLARQTWPQVASTASPASRAVAGADSGASRGDERFRVAVLPFKHSGAGTDLTALADGLSEGIVAGLSRFSYFRVIARGAAPGDTPPRESAVTQVAAQYVLEGSLRQAATRLRVAVQLVDTSSGTHLWSDTYDRVFSPDAEFDLLDDLVPRIVCAVGDPHGVLPHAASEALRSKAPGQMGPYDAVLRSFALGYRLSSEEYVAVRAGLERAVEQAPGYADAWAQLSVSFSDGYTTGIADRPDPLGRALQAARRAIDAAPSNALGYQALARALFFRKEWQAFRTAAERAIELNPWNGPALAILGTMMAYAGDWEHGCALVERAIALHPRHPGWYWFALFYNAYRKGDYRGALNFARRIDLPHYLYTHVVTAAANAELGEREAASQAVRELLALEPDLASVVREEFAKWHLPDLVEHLVDGLRKAGLQIEGGKATPAVTAADRTRVAPSSGSGASRLDEGFWVAVLPFVHAGGDAAIAALAEGLSDEIVTGFSRFSYLRVIARSSTRRSAGGASDVRAVGRELGARYIMEGSVRHAGAQVRVSVQLVDAATGGHLWAETYTRTFKADRIFEVQDDLIPRIVSTCADSFGVLARSISDAVRDQAPSELGPYEALMRAFGYHHRLTPEEHVVVRDVLERAVERAPGNADCWAMLSWIYSHEHAHGFNPRPGSLDRALSAARRAVELAPSNHLAQQALAVVLFFRKDTAACLSAAERALALNPLDGSNEAIFLITFTGDWERGCGLIARAMDLNPHHPGWYGLVLAINEYRKGNYRAAVSETIKANVPGIFWTNTMLAAAHGQLGNVSAAVEALRNLLAQKEGFGGSVRELMGKWFEPQLVEDLVDGLRKAGLEVPAVATAPARTVAEGAVASRPSEKASAATVAIAVLPFSDLSSAKDQAYLCEGMAEEIMNTLVRVEGIRVASRNSAFRAGHGGGDLKAIAEVLSVSHVLEGSVRTSGSRLRVTARLTEVASGYHLWSERFDRDAADVFAVQDEIAAGVVEAVKARLGSGARTVQVRPQTTNLEAYRFYLKGRHLRHAKEDHGGAMRAFEQAVELDPTHAPSWNGLAESVLLAAYSSLVPAREACAIARKAVETAVSLQGESADSLHGDAFVALIERRWPAMEVAWRKAIELQPTHVQALGSFGISLCICGKREEGMRLLARAREADPLASFPYMLTGLALVNAGRSQDALPYLDDALSFEKEDVSALYTAGMAHVALGRLEDGIAALERSVALTGRGPHFLGVLGWALAVAGRTTEAHVILEELQARPARHPGAPTILAEAWLLAAFGRIDEAFAVLARVEAELNPSLCFIGYPCFDPLRTDPRFDALLERLGLRG